MGGETVPVSAATAEAPAPLQLDVRPLWQYAEIGARESSAYISCRLTAPDFEPVERPAIDLVAVIDVSGSMAGQKLKMVQSTLEFLMRNLKDTDRFALVTFDSDVKTVFDLRPMTTAHKEACLADVQKLRAGSCTNLSGGLFRGVELMQQRGATKGAVSSILLMTDGIANEGVRDKDDMCRALRGLMGPAPDYTIYTFGYGKDHNENMLRQLSETGNGMYYFIESNDIIPESFGDCLGGLLSVFAQNIEVKLSAVHPEATIKRVCMQRAATLADDRRTATFTIGDIQSEEVKEVLFEVNLPLVELHDAVAEAGTATAYFRADVSYLNLSSSSFEKHAATFSTARPAEVPAVREANEAVTDAIARFVAVDGMEEARRLAEAGKFDAVRERLQDVRGFVSANKSAQACNLVADLDDMLVATASREQYQQQGRYEMVSQAQAYSNMRSNRVWANDETRERFATKKKGMLRRAAKA
ncbi:uncharacterized protein MONBRDRAFT_33043 [Monosiga brevicollis MX1]|uniref:VWFA domain-containing protein n=1 Tax=Monosiga brevicollis TaxID=81824 RepID=A9V370_MONBE|nr:uncharacterized protein MONBRDRAFT_33043 [Monosiga brevicollis MX1]EDQ88136.1 predicted protein [Monosiga brevicollis MX1]|eukprot:XP_001747212.1 hypothetical protein [Monosiga brevicollis MX1]